MKYDLHTHTKYSPRCGVVEPKDLVKMAISKSLNGIAVTDHDTIKGGVAAKRFGAPDFEVIVGCEIKPKFDSFHSFLKRMCPLFSKIPKLCQEKPFDSSKIINKKST